MRYPLSILICVLTFTTYGQSFQPYPERHRRLVQSIAFSPDTSTLYFTLMQREYLEAIGEEVMGETPILAIYQAKAMDGQWSDPELMPFSGNHKDYEPTLSPDGKLLFFNSWRPVNGESVGDKNNVWFSVFENGVWSKARYMPKVNTIKYEESYPTITREGKLFMLAGREEEGEVKYGLFSTQFDYEETGPLQKEPIINDFLGSGDPWVSPDASYIIFTKFDMSIGWRETCDLYISFAQDGTWSSPQALSDLNSPGPDYAQAISPNGEWIYDRKNSQFIRLAFLPILEKMR